MSFKKIALAVLATAAVLPAMAQSAANVSPDVLKRAEVLADLDMWYAAGMHHVQGQWEIGDASQTPEFRKYQELRNSPQYVAAVQARLSGDTALASKAGGAQAAE
ncbi:hypothetical protein CCO03_12005 [Comamonas serinivorans]|uniref:DUF4148 domain-containing protein n=1 Tax=Comamonas serinivorans TaxID=1082851 RepID=A0A1Y0EPD7_9BURK|nr:hypothetical protein [Comamonas serinivorans]ARU05310.1 hypothetical protein CCO03_12005 [Comamonas serinivorans]